jgi:hypothetical protein
MLPRTCWLVFQPCVALHDSSRQSVTQPRHSLIFASGTSKHFKHCVVEKCDRYVCPSLKSSEETATISRPRHASRLIPTSFLPHSPPRLSCRLCQPVMMRLLRQSHSHPLPAIWSQQSCYSIHCCQVLRLWPSWPSRRASTRGKLIALRPGHLRLGSIHLPISLSHSDIGQARPWNPN